MTTNIYSNSHESVTCIQMLYEAVVGYLNVAVETRLIYTGFVLYITFMIHSSSPQPPPTRILDTCTLHPEHHWPTLGVLLPEALYHSNDSAAPRPFESPVGLLDLCPSNLPAAPGSIISCFPAIPILRWGRNCGLLGTTSDAQLQFLGARQDLVLQMRYL